MNDTMNVGTEEGAVCTATVIAAGYLREIANGLTPESCMDGLCYNLTTVLRRHGPATTSGCPIIQKYAPLWPEYSGDPDYPVPSQDEYDATSAYIEVDLWEGEYGEARRRLAGFIADELEKEI